MINRKINVYMMVILENSKVTKWNKKKSSIVKDPNHFLSLNKRIRVHLEYHVTRKMNNINLCRMKRKTMRW
jgi:hypothetical protein